MFTVPEAPESTLSRIDQDISRNLAGFLQEHIVAIERDLSEVEKDFSDYVIPEKPVFVSEQTQFLLDKLGATWMIIIGQVAWVGRAVYYSQM